MQSTPGFPCGGKYTAHDYMVSSVIVAWLNGQNLDTLLANSVWADTMSVHGHI